MREILFRAKTNASDSLWVEGFYNHIPCGRISCDEHLIQTIDSDGRIGQLFIVYESTVEQFTGLTDKNGKKIFEGDIVRHFYPDEEAIIGIVCFGGHSCLGDHDVGFYVSWRKPQCAMYMRDDLGFWTRYREIDVIGNIHDNPELLKEDL